MSNPEWGKAEPRELELLLVHAMGGDYRVLDFVGRLADAWNGAGGVVLNESEKRALCELAGLEPIAAVVRLSWQGLAGSDRRALLFAARRAIEFARVCAWCFGEGSGPQA